MIPFSGVRISWLMRERNSDFARFAASASAFAAAMLSCLRNGCGYILCWVLPDCQYFRLFLWIWIFVNIRQYNHDSLALAIPLVSNVMLYMVSHRKVFRIGIVKSAATWKIHYNLLIQLKRQHIQKTRLLSRPSDHKACFIIFVQFLC